jgi:hypothetical protein
MPRPNLEVNSNFTQRLTWNAQSKQWKTRDSEGFDVYPEKPCGVIAVDDIRTAWFAFETGGAPDIVWDVNGKKGPKPSDNHRRGFAVYWLLEDYGLREFSATSDAAIRAILKLYSEYEKAPEAAQGLLPIVEYAGAIPAKGRYGTSFEPELKITGWAYRPDELPEPEPISPGAAASTGRRSGSELSGDIPFG